MHPRDIQGSSALSQARSSGPPSALASRGWCCADTQRRPTTRRWLAPRWARTRLSRGSGAAAPRVQSTSSARRACRSSRLRQSPAHRTRTTSPSRRRRPGARCCWATSGAGLASDLAASSPKCPLSRLFKLSRRHGLAPELLARCDAVVRLPCRGLKNSLNVAVALGMCAHEAARQWAVGGKEAAGDAVGK
mmetsp:Transcript_1781/g.5802  ORF Transcript_1781/g.5802 Transcript_1781/m.5802 type:complete len:191 (-) Transcript_1781:69-641(-)